MVANNLNYPNSLSIAASKRFWTKVDKNGPICKKELGSCWIWTAYKNKDGYGRFLLKKGQMSLSYRLAYSISIGSVDENKDLDHLCENRACVNPNHLEVVTHSENVSRGNVGINNSIKTHCPRKHKLEPPNLVPSRLKRGQRTCLACSRAQKKYKNSQVRKNIILDPDLFQQVADEYYKQIKIGE